MKRVKHCQLPSRGSISGRSSSITNAFFNAVIPVIEPTNEETLEVLGILGMEPSDIRCAYCGDKYTEWDHFRPIITDQKPTGYITEIANLVPSCGKCNQSKGKRNWKEWMNGPAKLSPKTRNVAKHEDRVARLEAYETWREARKIDFAALVGPELWARHHRNWKGVLQSLKESQELAAEIHAIIGIAMKNKSAGVAG